MSVINKPMINARGEKCFRAKVGKIYFQTVVDKKC